jgi:uncharacterized Fe-S cluster-containing MiaB family protein
MRNRDYEKEIADLEAKLAETKREKAKVDAMPPAHRLADILHVSTCRHNHTDACYSCSYLYENWEQPGDSKGRELRRVHAILRLLNDDAKLAEQVIKALNNSKY